MKEVKYIGEETPEQIQEWKQKYANIYAVIVDGHIGYLRKPTRQEVSYSATVSQTNPMKSNEVLLSACWLGGSEAIKTDDELFFGASAKLAELVNVKDAELVNL